MSTMLRRMKVRKGGMTTEGGMLLSSLPMQLTVGMLAASYWRGAWYICDYTMFPESPWKSALTCFGLGSLLLGGEQWMLARHLKSEGATAAIATATSSDRIKALLSKQLAGQKMTRFWHLYTIGISCVLVWRSAWVGWDVMADYVHEEFFKTTAPKPTLSPLQQQQQQQPVLVLATSSHDAASQHPSLDTTLFYSGVVSHVVATLGLLCIGRFKSVMAPPSNLCMMTDTFIHGRGRRLNKAIRAFLVQS